MSNRKYPEIFGVSNDQSQMFPEYSGISAPHGQVMAFMGLPNDANFDATHLSQPLNDYVVRTVDDEGLQEELDGLAPPVPVGRQFQYLVANTQEDFQKDDGDNSDIREVGGDFKTLRPTGTLANGRTDNKGLIVHIDHDQNGRDPAVRQNWVNNLRNRLLRSDLSRLVTVLTNNASATTTASINWGASNAGVDPDGDMAQLGLESGDARGIDSNILTMSKTLWTQRFIALGRPGNGNPALTATRTLTPQQVADVLGFDKLNVNKRRYQYTAAGLKKQIFGTVMFAYYQKPGATPLDPSNVKRFVTTEDGAMIRVWLREEAKKTIILVEHYSVVLCTSTVGIKKTTITYT